MKTQLKRSALMRNISCVTSVLTVLALVFGSATPIFAISRAAHSIRGSLPRRPMPVDVVAKSEKELSDAFAKLRKTMKKFPDEQQRQLAAHEARIETFMAFAQAKSSEERSRLFRQLSISWRFSASSMIVTVAGAERVVGKIGAPPITRAPGIAEAPDGGATPRFDMTYEEADAYAVEAIAWHEGALAEVDSMYYDVLASEPSTENCVPSGPSADDGGPCKDAFRDAVDDLLGAAAYIGVNKSTIQAALDVARTQFDYYSTALAAGTISAGLFVDAVVGIVTTLVGAANLGWIASAAALAGAAFLAWDMFDCIASMMSPLYSEPNDESWLESSLAKVRTADAI